MWNEGIRHTNFYQLMEIESKNPMSKLGEAADIVMSNMSFPKNVNNGTVFFNYIEGFSPQTKKALTEAWHRYWGMVHTGELPIYPGTEVTEEQVKYRILNLLSQDFASNELSGNKGSSDSWIMALSVAKYDPKKPGHNDWCWGDDEFGGEEDDPDEDEENGFSEEEDDAGDGEESDSEDGRIVPDYVCRFVTRSQWEMSGVVESVTVVDSEGEHTSEGGDYGHGILSLVDGDQAYFVLREDGTMEEVYRETWSDSQPAYYGGPIPEALMWASKNGPLVHLCFENPFLDYGDEKWIEVGFSVENEGRRKEK